MKELCIMALLSEISLILHTASPQHTVCAIALAGAYLTLCTSTTGLLSRSPPFGVFRSMVSSVDGFCFLRRPLADIPAPAP
jgi:hypothetical protein